MSFVFFCLPKKWNLFGTICSVLKSSILCRNQEQKWFGSHVALPNKVSKHFKVCNLYRFKLGKIMQEFKIDCDYLSDFYLPM